MIGFGEASKRFFTRAFDFQGRASRSEFWFSLLMLILVGIAIFALIAAMGEAAVALIGIFYLVIIIPQLSLSVRRLHDSDKSGWWLLLSIVPLGSLVLIVFYCLEGTQGDNKFGPDPYNRGVFDVFN